MTAVQVAIIGAGPAGMILAHLLSQNGVSVVVLERHEQEYVESRVRAGVLEPATVALLSTLGLDLRVNAEGLVHDGVNIAIDGELFRIDLAALTGGSAITVYGQQEVMRDLFQAASERQIEVIFAVDAVEIADLHGDAVEVRYEKGASDHRVRCDFVVGCDGSHGVSRGYMTNARTYEYQFPGAWLGLLADVPPVADELIYGCHERGFALASMRSPSRSRYYIQCAEDVQLEDWPEQRLWDEIILRLGAEAGAAVTTGPAFETSVALLRSSVTEPMRCGRLFLAGDAAHIVPPTGAKGLNLAAADVAVLAEAISNFFANGEERGLRAYSDAALKRVWQAQRFSWWFTRLTHNLPGASPFEERLRQAELQALRTSPLQQTWFAQNYVGAPSERLL